MVMSAANTGEQELVKPSYLWFFLLTASGVAAENKGAHHGQEPHHSPYVDQTSSEIAARASPIPAPFLNCLISSGESAAISLDV